MTELLDTVDSQELAEYRAYEKYAGPVDSSYDTEMLAQILEWSMRAAGVKDVKPIPRPWLEVQPEERELSEEDKQRQIDMFNKYMDK